MNRTRALLFTFTFAVAASPVAAFAQTDLHADDTITIGNATAVSGTPLYSSKDGTLLSGNTYYTAGFEGTGGRGVVINAKFQDLAEWVAP